MDKNELDFYNKFIENLYGSSKVKSKENLTDSQEISLPKRKTQDIDNLLEERRNQREKLLKFICILAILSFTLLSCIVIMQSIVRIYIPSYKILEGNQLEILIVGVFGEVISLIYIIVKSLWDDSKYLTILK